MIDIIRTWMKMLGYPPGSDRWVRPYYSTISDFDKAIIAEAFKVVNEDNSECIILVASDAYGMGINNPDIKLVVQYDIPNSLDAMIQRMGRAGRKGGQSTFILLTPKWTQIKDQDEIIQRIAKRTVFANASSQLSATNRPIPSLHPSPLSKELGANDISDSESQAGSKAGSEAGSDDDLIDPDMDQSFSTLSTEAEEEAKRQKKAEKGGQSDAKKRANLPDEIFDYIHTAQCRRLFSLAWYDDMTYKSSPDKAAIKPLPVLCCNGPACQSPEPDYLKREPFIDSTPNKLSEAEREWIACRTAALKKWRSFQSKVFWLDRGS